MDNDSGLLQRQFFGEDTNEATGTATIHVPLADLDIDSNNNGSFDRDDDWIEIDSTKGRLVDVLNGDLDQDGIADRVDFNGIAGARFEPIKLSLSSNLQYAGYSNFDITFTYSMASANAASSGGDFRLWKVDAFANRSDLTSLIRSGQSISASSLGLSPGGSVTLYLEAVNASRNSVNFKEIKVDIAVSYGRFNGTLTDRVHASAVLPVINAIPAVISLVYRTESGNQIVVINEGGILPVSGTVKFRREVPSVEVAVWADLNFDGVKTPNEVSTVQATRNSQSNVNGDRFYEFSTSFLVLDDGPSPGNGGGVDSLTITATPGGGSAFNSFMIVQNVAPVWNDFPSFEADYSEFGIISSATISGSFSDVGVFDRHAIEIIVENGTRYYQEYNAGFRLFSIDIGSFDPTDGASILVNVLDDDLGKTSFYITVASIVSKSFIADVYASGGAGSVSVYVANPIDTYQAAELAAHEANLGLAAFAAATRLQFEEDPTAASTRGDSRLHSRHDYVVGYDGSQVRYFERIHEYLQAGFELIVLPAAIREDAGLRYENISNATSGRAGVFIIGSPNWILEPGINIPLLRTSSDLWYDLDLTFEMVGNYARFSLENTDASALPSNRVWINEDLKADYQQSTTVKLWQSSPIYGLNMVVGREELGIFRRQGYLMSGDYWIPIED